MGVKFGGIELESLSDTIHVIDVSIGAPGIDNTTIQPALMDGDIFARSRYAPRPVSISFVVMDNDMARRRQTIRKVAEWARSSQQKQLEVPQEPDGYLMAVCSAIPTNVAREYWQALTVEFVADDPFFQSNNIFGVQLNQEGTTTITVRQFDNPSWTITQNITSTLQSPMWGLGSTQISFTTLAPGALTIERRKQTADLAGRSALPSMFLGSRFFDLKSGTNIISTSGGAGGTLAWRERWI